ncbi:family 16 glycosylhydrolase [Flavobacterium sp.]|uniref:glycoside hydrolase family 16 protein n=1 Tax=Flavobacterium sp. TaxID=239 RepID=UPI003527A686
MKIFKIKYTIFSFTIIGIMFILSSCSNDETQQVTTFNNLVWAEEFDVDGAPDSNKWVFDIGAGGWGNNELQFYTDRPENIVVQNGYLIISALQENYQGQEYTSARIKTENLFSQKYGRFEARIKLPQGKGLWPAFWMLGSNFNQVSWPQCGEIDIMEYIGNKPTEVFGTIHAPGAFGANGLSKKYSLLNDRFDTDFHVFGIEWTENHINWYVDNVLYNQITRDNVMEKGGQWVFDNDFFMILNIAVGGNLSGNPDTNTIFPQRMLVDYVRVYN